MNNLVLFDGLGFSVVPHRANDSEPVDELDGLVLGQFKFISSLDSYYLTYSYSRTLAWGLWFLFHHTMAWS